MIYVLLTTEIIIIAKIFNRKWRYLCIRERFISLPLIHHPHVFSYIISTDSHRTVDRILYGKFCLWDQRCKRSVKVMDIMFQINSSTWKITCGSSATRYRYNSPISRAVTEKQFGFRDDIDIYIYFFFL